MNKWLLGAGAAGVAAVVKFVVLPSAAVSAQNAMGVGWDDARAEFVSDFDKALGEELAPIGLTQAEIHPVSECAADEIVKFLNGTDCSYQYNTATTTEAEHLAEQEKCMAKVKYDEQEEKVGLICLKQKLPNDWKVMRKSLIEGFAGAAAESGMPAAQAQTVASCFADKAIAAANEKKCPLINQAATKAEDLFSDMSKCVPDSDSERFGQECTGGQPGAAASAAAP